ncbi:MAG: hypothetical protein ACYDBL_13085 [Candidatus Acidiferrales bacterium]|jgi:uncharacterized protein (DUF58 family)
MRRFLVGTLLSLGIVLVALIIAARWPVVFWLLVLSVLVYLAAGRRVDIDVRLGTTRNGGEKRLYAAAVWKHEKGPVPTHEACADALEVLPPRQS